MRFTYPAVIHKESDRHYTGYFPDLEDCTFSGYSVDDAIDEAITAGANWIRVELEDEGLLPPVSDLDEIEAEDGDIIRDIALIIRLTDGWDE